MKLPLLALIPALPLAGVWLNLLVGDRLGKRGIAWLGCGVVGLSFALAVRATMRLAGLPVEARTVVEPVMTWIRVGDFTANISFLLDSLGEEIFSPVVNIREEPHLPRARGSAPFDNEGVADVRDLPAEAPAA